jgi:hypothetical protein
MTAEDYLGCFFMAPFSPTMEPLQTQGGSVDEVDVPLLDGSKETLQIR